MVFKHIWILIILVVSYSTIATSQIIRHIGVEDGLRDRKVTSIFQDSRGIIWANTDPGLHIFTGYDTDFYDSPVNNFGYFGRIIEDNHGHLFYANSYGISVIDLYTHTESSILKYKDRKSCFIHTDGYIRLQADSQLYTYKDGQWLILDMPSKFIEDKIKANFALQQLKDGRYQLKGPSKVNLILDHENNPEFAVNDDNHESYTDGRGGWIITDTTGRYWMKYKYGRFRSWDKEGQMFCMTKKFKANIDVNVKVLQGDGHGYFSLLGGNKIYGFNPYTDSTFIIAELPKEDNGYDMLIQDQRGGYIVAGNFGFYIVNLKSNKFETILDTTSSDIPFANSTRMICKIGTDSLMISTRISEYIYDIRKNTLTPFANDVNRIYGLYKTENQKWIGASGKGIVEVQPTIPRLNVNKRVTDSQANFKSIFSLKEKFILGHSNALFTIKKDLSQFKKVIPWPYGRSYDFLKLKNEQYVIASKKGLVIVDSNLNILKDFTTTTHPTLKSNLFYSMTLRDNVLWLSTDIGVYQLDLDSEKITQFEPDNLALGSTVYATIFDKGNIWLPTDAGLAFYNTSDKTTAVFTQKDGLSHYEFNSNSHLIHKDKLYLGTLNGITIVDLNNSYVQEQDISLFIYKASVYDASIKKFKIKNYTPSSPHIDIYPNESNLRLDVALADYTNPDRNTIFYKIKGFHNEWQTANGHILEIGNLAAGKHQLDIKGVTSDGLKSTEHIQLFLHYHIPIYQSWWFIIAMIGLIFLLLWSIYKWRLNQINKVVKVRQKIAANLHDEVGSMMTRIAFESDLIQSKIYSPKESDAKLKSISDQSREATSVMSDIVWSFSSKNDNIESLISRMKQNLFEMLDPQNITFEMESFEGNKDKKLDPTFRQNVYLIFKETIHNVVKHSNANYVLVSIKLVKHDFTMSIHDNGTKTIDKGYPSTGMGLTNMKERAKSINAKLTISKENGFKILLTSKI